MAPPKHQGSGTPTVNKTTRTTTARSEISTMCGSCKQIADMADKVIGREDHHQHHASDQGGIAPKQREI
jgi:hypothetical protein